MSPLDPWTALAQAHGRKSVMSIDIDDAALDAETERQAAELFPMIRTHLRGDERTALDFGCGAGRFTRHLDRLVSGPTLGYDPCAGLIDQRGDQPPGVSFVTGDPDRFFAWPDRPAFDLVFTAMVVAIPGVEPNATADGLASVTARGGLLVVADHMGDPEPWRWVRVRPVAFYVSLFAARGIALREIGRIRQLDAEITVLAGRL